jgi:endonuclease/exonuclease/phosphatase family metal-dependent hydrolase
LDAELDGMKYPELAVARLKPLVPESIWNERVKSSLDAGIPVMGAFLQMQTRTVLAVTVDLQCCGNPTNNWPEIRRQIEAQEIRGAIHRVLARRKVDAILLAGDLNLVFSATPLALLTNPYPEPHFALVPANAVHLEGTDVWTWDGRNSPFPSRALDFSLFTPASLQPVRSLVLSTEDFSRELLSSYGFESGTSRKLSDHLPILVDYRWQGL